VKGSECPDEWFSNMLYLNEQIVKANGTRRSDAEIIAHIINVAKILEHPIEYPESERYQCILCNK
jgi:hypothetical protein